MISLILEYLLPVGALLVALLTAFFVGKSKQKTKGDLKTAEVKLKKVEAIAAKQFETVKGVNDVENDINKLEPSGVAKQLRDKWQRD